MIAAHIDQWLCQVQRLIGPQRVLSFGKYFRFRESQDRVRMIDREVAWILIKVWWGTSCQGHLDLGKLVANPTNGLFVAAGCARRSDMTYSIIPRPNLDRGQVATPAIDPRDRRHCQPN